MANSNGQNQYPGYGQAPPAYGGYPQMQGGPPGSSPYPVQPGQMQQPRGVPPSAGPHRSSSSSRALPIIVAGGLAIGVFGGLMIVRGTGPARGGSLPVASDAGTTVAVVEDAGTTPEATPDAAVAVVAKEDAGTAAKPPPDAGTTTVKVVDAGVPVVKKDAGPPRPDTVKAVIEFDIQPTEAVVTVDGNPIKDSRYEVELAKGATTKVKIRATADGFYPKTITQKVTADTTVRIRLGRKRGNGNSGRDPDRLIDL